MNPRDEIREIVAGMENEEMRQVMRDLLEMADELRVMTSAESRPASALTPCLRRRRRHGRDRN